MSAAKRIILGVGLLAVLIGLIWIGQGTGVFPYPRQSFMIDQRPWAWRGGMLAVAGLAAILLGRSLRAGQR